MNELELCGIAKEIRKDIVTMSYRAPAQIHPAPSLSCVDLITALYFEIMRVDPQNPKWADRDRFILSKGHACPALYAALARRGYFSRDELWKVRGIGNMLQGHPDMKKIPGVDMTSGSLGNGLSAGVGMALYGRAKKKDYKTFVIVGDGEAQEGAIWEAAITAASKKLDNLVCVVDYNHLQSCGEVDVIAPMHPFVDKWSAFGWETIEINGHDMREICSALRRGCANRGRPTAIIAHTIKGRGVSFMEYNNIWHARRPTDAEYAQAMRDIEGGYQYR